MTASVLYGLAAVINIVLNMLMVLIFISVMISFLNADPTNPYVRMVSSLTEPLYRPVRRLTSRIPGPFDFAPMVVMLVVVFLHKAIPRYLQILSLDLQ